TPEEMPAPTWRLILGRGVPLSLMEGIVPVLLFYGIWKTIGLVVAVVVATAFSLGVAALQVRRGAAAGLACASAVFIVVQAIASIGFHSARVFVARPLVISV